MSLERRLAALEAQVAALEQGVGGEQYTAAYPGYSIITPSGVVRLTYPLVYVVPLPSGGNDTATLQAAIDAVIAQGGGTIALQPGTYHYTSLTFRSTSLAIIFQGTGGVNSGLGAATTLICTAAGAGNGIDCTGTAGITIAQMQLVYSAAGFTGVLVNAANSSNFSIDGCYLGGQPGATSASPLILLQNAIIATLRNLSLGRCVYGIQGRLIVGDFSNVVLIDHVAGTAGLLASGGAWIANAGQAWQISNCTFEPDAGGNGAAYVNTAAAITQTGISFINCWFGDASVSANWIVFSGSGLSVIGCYISTPAVGGTGITISGSSNQGMLITGNAFTHLNIAIRFTGTNNQDAVIFGNGYDTVAQRFQNGPGMLFGAIAYDNAVNALAAGNNLIQIDTVQQDPAGNFDTVNGWYTATMPGFYIVLGQVQVSTTGALTVLSAVAVNGAIVAFGARQTTTPGGVATLPVAALVGPLAAGDHIQLYLNASGAGASTNAGSPTLNYLHVIPLTTVYS